MINLDSPALGKRVWGIVICLVVVCFSGATLFAQGVGTISGRVTDSKTGEPLASINVTVKATTLGAATDTDGEYVIRNVPPGIYKVAFTAIGFGMYEATQVEVRANETVVVNAELTPAAIPVSETMVYGVSLRPERITEAPAAVSVLGPEEIKEHGNHGQLPRLLESLPGVDLVQSGVQDFNLNTRGFNSSLNRRVLVLLDGRDLAIVLLGVQEWNGLSLPLDDLGRVELVRGPGSALYGANAYSGVLNITTPAPKDVLGTKISFTGGELATFRGDVRHAAVAGDWSYRFNLGGVRTDTWTVSRTASEVKPGTLYLDTRTGLTKGTFDYTNLLLEQRPYNPKQLSSVYMTARVDRDFADQSFLTLEGGMTQVENEVFLTGIGRVAVPKARRPYARAAYTSEHIYAQAWVGGRKAIGPHYSLQSGGQIRERSENAHIEFQHNLSAVDDKLRVVWGASHRYQHEDSEGTLMPSPRFDNWSGVFSQVEYRFTEEIKGVVAGRFDRSTLHKDQWSPKAALVYAPTRNHSFRVTVNRAFQVPNYSELFLQADASAPTASPRQLEVGLEQYFAAVKAALGPAVTPLNLPSNLPWEFKPITRILALGNNNLDVEKVTSVEVGYKGILDDRFSVSVDVYRSRLTDFVTDLLPGVNPTYPRYSLSDGGINILKNLSDLEAVYNQLSLPATHPLRVNLAALRAGYVQLAAQLGPLLATLPTGDRAGVISYTNAGRVDEVGFEVGGKAFVTDELSAEANWSYFDFTVKAQQLGDVLLPNSPKHKFNATVSYAHRAGYNAGVSFRWVQKYPWAAGIFQGDIPEYAVVNLVSGYQITKNVHLGVNVFNLLNRKHYEIFGGSVLERRILGTVTTTF
jgi:outer membrane receptor protein involved in Fe transport